MKKLMSVMIVAVATISATATIKADEYGVGVPIFSYRSKTPVVQQSTLPVYQPGLAAAPASAPASAAPTAPAAPVYIVQPDGTLKLVNVQQAPVVVAPPATPVKTKEFLFRPGITFFKTREW